MTYRTISPDFSVKVWLRRPVRPQPRLLPLGNADDADRDRGISAQPEGRRVGDHELPGHLPLAGRGEQAGLAAALAISPEPFDARPVVHGGQLQFVGARRRLETELGDPVYPKMKLLRASDNLASVGGLLPWIACPQVLACCETFSFQVRNSSRQPALGKRSLPLRQPHHSANDSVLD